MRKSRIFLSFLFSFFQCVHYCSPLVPATLTNKKNFFLTSRPTPPCAQHLFLAVLAIPSPPSLNKNNGGLIFSKKTTKTNIIKERCIFVCDTVSIAICDQGDSSEIHLKYFFLFFREKASPSPLRRRFCFFFFFPPKKKGGNEKLYKTHYWGVHTHRPSIPFFLLFSLLFSLLSLSLLLLLRFRIPPFLYPHAPFLLCVCVGFIF